MSATISQPILKHENADVTLARKNGRPSYNHGESESESETTELYYLLLASPVTLFVSSFLLPYLLFNSLVSLLLTEVLLLLLYLLSSSTGN
ncbi:hypothetical protein RIF29_31938 [Crotalaria pallida]|uniref:Uncharacterized protein n=1 Tax=Crotalaria pallida TaxID=3830 RepID=A0AAN9HZ38_CROPI